MADTPRRKSTVWDRRKSTTWGLTTPPAGTAQGREAVAR